MTQQQEESDKKENKNKKADKNRLFLIKDNKREKWRK